MINRKVIHVPIGTTQQMKMSCATFKAKTENPPMAPFAKGGGPKDRGIFASSRHFHKRAQRTQKRDRNIFRQGAKAAKLTGRCPSSRANVRDLGKISPFGRNDIKSELGALCALARGNSPIACN
jgi:hypothetical protein